MLSDTADKSGHLPLTLITSTINSSKPNSIKILNRVPIAAINPSCASYYYAKIMFVYKIDRVWPVNAIVDSTLTSASPN